MRLGQIPGNSGMGWGTGWAAGLGRSLLSRPPAIGVPCRKLLPVKRSPSQKARRLKEPIPLKRFAHTGKTPHRVSLSFIFRITDSTPVPRHVRKQHAEAKEAFSSLLACPWKSLFWQWLVLGLTASVILRGASGGIEKATRILIPLLFILLVVVCIRSLTLPNAMEGLKFLFMPDFSRIDGSVVLMAMGLAFFKMSIGFGCMITYGSYFRSDTHVPFLAVRVMVCDLLVSILAGIAVFPAVFSFGFEPTAGTSLLFLTIPAVFASMPGGQLFTTLFFVLSAVASMGAMLSLLEVPVAWLSETFRISRPRATVLMTLALILLGAPATLSTSVLSDVTVFGLSLFDLYDFLSSNLMLPLDGLLLSLFVGYVWNRSDALDALTNGGTLHNLACAKAILFLCRYVTPILIVIILLNGLKVF